VTSVRAAALLFGALLGTSCRPAEGPQPILYDREGCAHCRMLISEPRFAAQLLGADGTVASFDDPGCLLAYQGEREEGAAGLWFHHLREDRWIEGAQVAFEPVDKTPMGYGLGAVDAGSTGALSLAAAREQVAARRARPGSRVDP
jgi:hypothetical protein